MNEDVLFDALGPRAKARLRIVSVICGLVLTAIVVALLVQLGLSGQLDPDRWAMLADGAILRFLLQGLWMTLLVGLVSTAFSVVLGVFLALGRLSRTRWLGIPSATVIEFFRAMPLLLILFFFMFGLPLLGVRIPLFWQLVCAIVAHAGAIFAEIVRAGILAIGRGQSEAGKAIGLRHWEVMAFIVLPQAARALTPALVSQMVRVIKESSLGYVVGLAELLNNGKVLSEFSGNFIQAYVGVGVIYILVNIALSRLAERLAEGKGAVKPRVQERS
ncbi:amino acid ABC transporter permease [Amycolatopsis sp. NPDC059027]|uniref:amino acid ABC transporter permease n=1 Tax=unclassified Amycolatopsis TaxID=2618356 RepID=UPI0036714D6C